MMKKKSTKEPIQPVSRNKESQFARTPTFSRLSELRDVKYCDVVILGIPFDAGKVEMCFKKPLNTKDDSDNYTNILSMSVALQ